MYIMPEWICEECGHEARDKYAMERHMKRKYPCNSVGIASKEKLEVIKIKDIKEEDLLKEKEPKKLKYKMKINIGENVENIKLEKE